MAVIRDTMPAFDLFQPSSVDETLALLARHGKNAWVLAGGLDSFDWLKDRIKRPRVVVDLAMVRELRGIRATQSGVEIGATTPLAEVASHGDIKTGYGLLASSAGEVASPQIRNQGTLGGNICQDARCWYYRDGWPCYRAGGNVCYADTPSAINREHCVFEANRCVAVNPSDAAPALVALDAQMVVLSRDGEKVVDAENFFLGPSTDITRMTVLRPGELLTQIRVPSTWAGARFYFEKVRDREVWNFPLVNVASALVVRNDRIEQARVVVNAVAARPLRLRAVEDGLRGRSLNEDTAEWAGRTAAEGAQPLQHNGYKVPLMRNLVKRAIRGTEV